MYRDLSSDYYSLLTGATDVVLLETSKYDNHNRSTLLFFDPITNLQINRICDVPLLFRLIKSYLSQGYYLAGYFTYECGYYFEDFGVEKGHTHAQPVAWFGVYNPPLIFDHLVGSQPDPLMSASPTHVSGAATDSRAVSCGIERFGRTGPPVAGRPSSASSTRRRDPQAGTLAPALPLSRSEKGCSTGNFALSNLRFDLTEREYSDNIAKIKEYIRAGDTYQINFTGRYLFDFTGSSLDFYQTLKSSQQISYGAYIRAAGQEILCFSPELFFRLKNDRIVTRPMKGTVARGRTLDEDQENAQWLQQDEKNRAENLMIVDLLRNDLGRICRPGSIRVPELFTIEKFNTLFQMTSSVEGTVEGELDPYQLFRSLFPSGSVTGAPKIRSMQIIRELEKSPRGVYCGAIGYFAPEQTWEGNGRPTAGSTPVTEWSKAAFNVAIRTIVLRDGRGEMGVGSGIVHDSVAAEEHQECMVKARFLTGGPMEFALLDAILWDKEYVDLERHLDRLAQSAEYFGYPYNRGRTHEALAQENARFVAGQNYKVRVVLDRTGAIACSSEVIERRHPEGTPKPAAGYLSRRGNREAVGTIALGEQRTDSHDSFLYHKTTNRALYNKAFQQAREQGFADVVFLNERGEVTEGAINNIFVRKNGRLLTPPVRCGLLNGIYRQRVLEERPDACEQVLYWEDLQEAEEIYLCNSVRGWQPVTLIRVDAAAARVTSLAGIECSPRVP